MQLTLQRSPDETPYLGAFFRIAGEAGEPARGGIVLAPSAGDRERDLAVLSRMLGLAIALGGAEGGAPIRQYWLAPDGRLQGKLGSEIAPYHAGEAERLGERLRAEWDRFLGKALSRLEGEPRGDAHFRFPAGGWDPDAPSVRIVAWPPLPGEALPPLA